MIQKSLTDLPGLPEREQAAHSSKSDEFVERLESAGKRIGIARNTNESVLAYGDRLVEGTEEDAFSAAAAMISEHLYGNPESVDTDELEGLLERLDTRTPPGGQQT